MKEIRGLAHQCSHTSAATPAHQSLELLKVAVEPMNRGCLVSVTSLLQLQRLHCTLLNHGDFCHALATLVFAPVQETESLTDSQREAAPTSFQDPTIQAITYANQRRYSYVDSGTTSKNDMGNKDDDAAHLRSCWHGKDRAELLAERQKTEAEEARTKEQVSWR